MSDIRRPIAALVRAVLVVESPYGIAADDLTDATLLDADLALASLGLLRVMIALEDELGVRFDEERLARTTFATVGDLVAWVESYATAPGAGR
jgi:acyl carrier protein